MEWYPRLYSKYIVFNVKAAVGMKKDIHPPPELYDRVNPCQLHSVTICCRQLTYSVFDLPEAQRYDCISRLLSMEWGISCSPGLST